MGYCKNCGAYIPDGHAKCLACGQDQTERAESAQTERASSAAKKASGQRVNTEELRRHLEEQRRKQQENNRRWAEAEYAQRQKAKEQRERDYEAERGEGYTSGLHRDTRSGFSGTQRPRSGAGLNRLFAILSYFGVLFILPYLLCREDTFAMFHARQGMILFIASAVAQAVGAILGLGWVATLLSIYMIIKGVTNSANGKMEPLPYIGGFFQSK